MNHPVLSLVAAFSLSHASTACLPADTRSPPATVVLSVEADDAIRSGIASETTADAWSIRYERFLVVFGHGELTGDDCDAYVEGGYARIFDLLEPGPQRANVLYGLGRCELEFSFATPAWDTLRGAGVSEEDELALRTPGKDSVSDGIGVSVWVEGRAERAGESKRFSWPFRRFIQYSYCELPTLEGVERGLSLAGHETVEVVVSMRGAPLFRETAEETANLRFDPFRNADDIHGDADGVVTLAELESTPWVGSGTATLAEHLYLELLPEIVRYRGAGRCRFEASSEPPSFGGP